MTLRAERKQLYEEIGRVVYARYRKSAISAVYWAIRYGNLVKPATLLCEDCSQPAECYDHRHYDQPLVVAPVCWGCNIRRGMGALDLERLRLDLQPLMGPDGGEDYTEDEDVA